MQALALLLLLAAPPVGIHLEDPEGEVSLDDGAAIAELLARAVEARSGRPAVLDASVWSECDRSDRCLDDVRARTQADDLVLIKLFRGLTRLRLVAERFRANRAPQRAEQDLSSDRTQWPAAAAAIARALFEPKREESEDPITTAPPPPPTPRLWPALTAGGVSLVVLGAGIGLAVDGRAVQAEAIDRPHTGKEYQPLADRAESEVIAANVLFGVAGAAAVTAVVLYLIE